MTEPLLAFALLVAIAAFSIGRAKLVSWLLDRRDRTASQQSREVAFVAQVRADLAATGWTFRPPGPLIRSANSPSPPPNA